MNINEKINEITDKVIEDKLPAIIEEKVTGMMTSIVEDIFRSYSDTAKQIKEVIQEKLNISLESLKMDEYNTIIGNLINKQLTENINISVGPIENMIKDTVGYLSKKEWKLSEIVDMFEKIAMEAAYSDESDGEFTLHIKPNEKHKWVEVSFDAETDVKEYECGISFIISTERNTIFSFKYKDWRHDQKEVNPSRLLAMSHAEREIFRLYSNNVKIEIDETDFETYWSRHDY
jgi:hypothetical protein